MQTPRFRVNRHVLLLLAVVLFALALPLGLVILALAPRGGQGAPASEPSALRENLERLAGRELPAPTLEPGAAEWRIMVPEPARATRHTEAFARELGGTAVVSPPSRVLVRLPAGSEAEFLRRVS
ncbi:MAG: hypothetical protein N2322_01460, partial [Terrimicrobiaceae bacterium]|nr:hypothetical protein [Terrimicrobiaceae bacterium]